jgi:threonine dehydratase
MRHIHAVTGDGVEGAAAVGVAAILAGRISVGRATLCILSGANVAPETVARILRGQAV